MTNRYLTGGYPGGYTLNARYTGLVIEQTASVGGVGVYVGFAATVENLGSIQISSRNEGVTLAGGGAVINGSAGDTTATIAAYEMGVRVDRAPGTIVNYGLLSSSGGVPIYLYDGGRVTNGSGADTTARISGFDYGVYASRQTTTVTNFGAIYSETSAAVLLRAGGSVTNGSAGDTGASLIGETGVGITGLPATLANFGTIEGTDNGGVYLNNGGGLTNGSASDTVALIEANSNGIAAADAATIVNYGTVHSVANFAVYLGGGGSLTNGSSSDAKALVEGVVGLEFKGADGATATNFGAISGSGGLAVELTSASDRLVLEASAAFGGSIAGGGGVLELAGGTDAINGVGYAPLLTETSGSTVFSGFGGYIVDTGASVSLTGVNNLVSGKTLTNNGQVSVTEFMINRGVISGAATSGVTLDGAATLINGSGGYTSASISGSDQGIYASASATVVNYATIKGAGGVEFNSGGSVTNGSAATMTGLIEGPLVGVAVQGAAGTIANFATIQSADGSGVYLGAGGRVTNGSAGHHAALITGATTGVYVRAAATVTNFGTIDGGGGTAVKFRSASDVLVVEAASTLIGLASGDGGTLEIGSGADTLTAPGTLTGSTSASLSGFASYAIDAGASLTVAAGVSITQAGTVRNAGTLFTDGGATLTVAAGGLTLTGAGFVELSRSASSEITGATTSAVLTNASDDIEGGGDLGAGSLVLVNQAAGVIASVDAEVLTIDTGASTITNAGLILAGGAGGVMITGAVANSGHLAVNGGPMTVVGAVTGSGDGEVIAGTLDFAGTFNQNVVFTSGSTGTLELAHSLAYAQGRIQGLSAVGANSLDLGDIGFTSGATTAKFAGTASSGVLTVTDGTHTAKINLIGDYLNSTFTTSAGAGGVGTRIIDTRPIPWTHQISGSFTTAADWTGGVAPGSANAAILDAPGSTAYIVIAGASETVASVQTASTARLAITGGVFTITNGTGSGSNAGQLSVTQNGTLDIGGVFANAKVFYVENNGVVKVAAGGLTLTGSGTLYLADNTVEGVTSGATLTTSNFIYGAGQLGAGQMTLVNQAAGVIESYGSSLLTVNTGANTITNAGIFLATSAGGMTIASAVANTGHFAVNGGSMTVIGAVTGAGYGEVVKGTLDFAGAFNENVVFTSGSTGTLELADSLAFAKGRIQGLSTTGANALDLGDITFTSGVTTAVFSGSTTSGVLTVTDGTHTAEINLIGDYQGSIFTTSPGAGGVGTRIVDPQASAAPTTSALSAPPHAFIAAMATLGAETGGSVSWTHDPGRLAEPMLTIPRIQAA